MHFNDYRLPIIIYRLVNFELEWIECVEESIGNWHLIVLIPFPPSLMTIPHFPSSGVMP